MKLFGVSLLPLFGPCAATIFGRRVPFSRVACAVWRSNRLRGPCSRIRHPSEVSSCSILLELHQHETGGTSELRERVPSFRGFRQPEPCVHFQPVRCSTGASQCASQYHLARVVLIRAILSSDYQSARWSPRNNVTSESQRGDEGRIIHRLTQHLPPCFRSAFHREARR